MTTTGPDLAFAGTFVVIDVSLQVDTAAEIPLNVTILEPLVLPNFVPLILTTASIPPEVGERARIVTPTGDA